MGCITAKVSNAFFVRWGEIQVSDVSRIVLEVTRAHAEAGRMLVLIAIAPHDMKAPDVHARGALSSATPSILQHCKTTNLVIEGDGVKRAFIRTVATGIFLLSGDRGRSFAFENVEAALTNAGKDLADPAAFVLEKARHLGVLTP